MYNGFFRNCTFISSITYKALKFTNKMVDLNIKPPCGINDKIEHVAVEMK